MAEGAALFRPTLTADHTAAAAPVPSPIRSKRSTPSAATAAPIRRAASRDVPASAIIAKTMTRRRSANSAWARVGSRSSSAIVTIVSPEPASQ